MIALYIIIFLLLLYFILKKKPNKKAAPQKSFITPEQRAYYDAVALKMAEPPEIIYGIDPLQNERLVGKKIGRFQTAFIQQKLYIPADADNFFCFKEMNGYQLGLTVSLAVRYLQARSSIENTKFECNKNGATVILEQINKGLRTMNYDLLEEAGKIKYNNQYKKANKIKRKEELFYIKFLVHKEIIQLLKNESFIVKNATTGKFENNVSYCETKECYGLITGGAHFQLFIGGTLIYQVQTAF